MRRLFVPLIATLAFVGCQSKAPADDPSPSRPKAAAPSSAPAFDAAATRALFKPLPSVMEAPSNPITPAKVDLGRMLYFEKRLSKNHDISCNSCHDLARYGVDNEPTSPGHKGQRGERNSPTVYNAGGHVAQFWDGRAADLEAQAKGPVLNPVEMAMPDEGRVLATLKSMPAYVAAFKAAFPDATDPVTYDNFGKAVGAFERTLVTPSRFDAWLRGQADALTAEEKTGLGLFVSAGCVACHNGPYVGGALYQKLGLVTPWPGLADAGRGKVTGDAAQTGFFKVPSLRNVAKTAPYLHDGSVADLPTMVRLMAKHQSGRDLSAAEITHIVTFLNALTGTLPAEAIKAPNLPPSSATTPKPDPS